jgi:hypothetical protein
VAWSGCSACWGSSSTATSTENFAGLLPLWDLLFGTYHLPEELPEEYGTRRPVPQGYLDQMMFPLRGSAPAPDAAAA